MSSRLDLSGAWVNYDQDAIYYIRHRPDNSIWWAGLRADGFHPGVTFTNVFHGKVSPTKLTIEGMWADVPRGINFGHGRVGLDIIESAPQPDDSLRLADGVTNDGDNDGKPHPTPSAPIRLKPNPARTSGGFGGSGEWRTWFLVEPQDIGALMHRVWRYDNRLDAEHPPYKDFGVVFGHIGANGASLNWEDGRDRDYCLFIQGDTGQCGDGDCDGDLTFPLELSPDDRQTLDCQRGFWSEDWIRPPGDILGILNRFKGFESEAGMFGRENMWFNCDQTPTIGLPGWMESLGNSVLVNGLPIASNAFREEGLVTVVLVTPEAPRDEYRVRFRRNARARLTGVITIDTGHYSQPWYDSRPEIHPFYAVDLLQNFDEERSPEANLTGVWHCDDVGTYYLRQIDKDVVWWLGMSRDQGRTFANVFRGLVDGDTLVGEWADVPMGRTHVPLSGGELEIVCDSESLTTATVLRAASKTGGFSGSVWTKLFDRPLPSPDRLN